jgi:glycosyltransferase involved in cell wall biosynthesis
MAMGLPVVANRVGMVPEVIHHGTSGLVVEPGDSAALATAVQAILADDTRRLGLAREARAAAVRGFSLDTMVGRYLDVIAETLDARRRAPWRPAGRPAGR